MTIKVLLVDDEEWFGDALGKRLRSRGFDVSSVTDGESAVARQAEQPADVVVLDVHMPGLDGRETLERLLKTRPETRVIMLTAHGSIEDAVAGLRVGAVNYLQKPCDIQDLIAAIEQAAGSRTNGAQGS